MSDTATATPVAPAAPSAPVPQMIDQSAPATIPIANPARTFNDSIRAIANKTGVAQDPAPTEQPTVRFVADPKKVVADAPGSHDAPPGSVPPIAPEAPAGDASESVSAEPVTEISVDDGEVTLASQRNADGTFKTKLDPNEKVDLVIKSVIDPETGKPKVYSKSLPELARLAKDGITLQPINQKLQGQLQELTPEVEYYRTSVGQWKEHTESLSKQLADMAALNRELLSADEAVVIEHRDRYRAEMSPERQLERLKAERAADAETRKQTEQQQAAQARREQRTKVATSFMESRIAPSLKAAQDAGVPRHTVIGLVTEITTDLMQQGVIPPANWPEMERRINAPDGPFQTEIRAEQARRAHDTDAVTAARVAAEAAQKKAQAIVNADGRLMAPIGRAGGESAPQLPKPKNVQEVKDRLINRPLPASV